jgi:hypothetical protein
MARIGSKKVNGAPPKLSRRGDQWSRVEFLHGKEGSFDPETNPQGVVRLDNSENVSPLILLSMGNRLLNHRCWAMHGAFLDRMVVTWRANVHTHHSFIRHAHSIAASLTPLVDIHARGFGQVRQCSCKTPLSG